MVEQELSQRDQEARLAVADLPGDCALDAVKHTGQHQGLSETQLVQGNHCLHYTLGTVSTA